LKKQNGGQPSEIRKDYPGLGIYGNQIQKRIYSLVLDCSQIICIQKIESMDFPLKKETIGIKNRGEKDILSTP